LFPRSTQAVLSKLTKMQLCLGAHLFVKVSRPGVSEGTFSGVESSCHHLLLPAYSLKGRGNPVKCLAKDTTSEHAGLSSHYPLCWTL